MRLLTAIVDTKGEEIVGPIIMVRNETVALRSFTDVMQDPGNPMVKHPEDYELRVLAYFNPSTLEVLTTIAYDNYGQKAVPYTLITAAQWVAAQPQTEEQR